MHARRHRPPLSASPTATPGSIKVTKRHDEGDTIPGKKAGNVPPFAAMHGPKHARRQPLLVQGIEALMTAAEDRGPEDTVNRDSRASTTPGCPHWSAANHDFSRQRNGSSPGEAGAALGMCRTGGSPAQSRYVPLGGRFPLYYSVGTSSVGM